MLANFRAELVTVYFDLSLLDHFIETGRRRAPAVWLAFRHRKAIHTRIPAQINAEIGSNKGPD